MAEEEEREDDERDSEESPPSTTETESNLESSGRESSERESSDDADDGLSPSAAAMVLGPERFVLFSFMAAWIALFWVLIKVGYLIWDQFQEPDNRILVPSALLVSAVGLFVAYRHPTVNKLSHEVVTELLKVSWPSRQETSTATVVVIVTSIVAAVLVGIFDTLWSAFTDLIYTV